LNIAKRDKKFLVGGALAFVLFLIITYVIAPFIESEKEIQEGTQQKEMILQKYERIINQRGEVEKKLAQLRGKQNEVSRALLQGSTPSLAAAEMQKILEKMSSTHELELKSVKVQDAEERGAFLAIPIEVRLITDLNRTRKFLADLEKNQKYFTIPQLRISVQNQRDPKEVIVTLVITGFCMKESTGEGKKA
jgi:Tfp pilus assembly protein PilO